MKALGSATRQEVPLLLREFGQHLFPRLISVYQEAVREKTTVLDFLLGIERRVHAEVRKLYPEAELPSIKCQMPDPQQLVMEYSSARALADLAHGLLLGCIAYFGDAVTLERRALPGEANAHALFVLTRAAE